MGYSLRKMFAITSVCREDLISAGYPEKEVEKLDDAQMNYLADKLTDGMMGSFWASLEFCAEDNFGLKKSKQDKKL